MWPKEWTVRLRNRRLQVRALSGVAPFRRAKQIARGTRLSDKLDFGQFTFLRHGKRYRPRKIRRRRRQFWCRCANREEVGGVFAERNKVGRKTPIRRDRDHVERDIHPGSWRVFWRVVAAKKGLLVDAATLSVKASRVASRDLAAPQNWAVHLTENVRWWPRAGIETVYSRADGS